MVKNIKKNSSLFSTITQLLFPRICYSCQKLLSDQKNEIDLCPECQAKLEIASKQKPNIYSLYKYNSIMQKLIHHLKYNQKKSLGKQLCYLNSDKIKKQLSTWKIDAIVPVPLYRTRYSHRGYNQSQQISKALCKIMNIPIYPNACKRVHYTKAQAKLNKAEREKNLVNAFRSNSKMNFANQNLLAVDDVLTTGSTLKHFSISLQKLTSGKIYGFTLATASEK